MSYSNDTAEYMFSGHPTMSELREKVNPPWRMEWCITHDTGQFVGEGPKCERYYRERAWHDTYNIDLPMPDKCKFILVKVTPE